MKQIKDLINFEYAQQIVDSIMSKEWSPSKQNYDSKFPEHEVKYRMKDESLKSLQLKESNDKKAVNFAKDVDRNINRNSYSQFINHEHAKQLVSHMNQSTPLVWRISGIYHTPVNGFCGWHHNGDVPGDRIYLVWAEEDNKSYFKWQDPVTKKIHTTWEKKGWNINHFIAPSWHGLASWTNRISIGLAHEPHANKHILRGKHVCRKNGSYGDWRITKKKSEVLHLPDIAHLLTRDKVQIIDHRDICWKGMDDPFTITQDFPRYHFCDIWCPGILLRKGRNPKKLKYRMLDGKHRMAKLHYTLIEQSQFFVLEWDDIKNYIKPLQEKENFIKKILSKNE